MHISEFGYTYEVDLHGMTVAETKRELAKFLTSCPKDTKSVSVVHGYSNGNALQTFVRGSFSHPRLERKIVGLNRGETEFILKLK